MTAIKLHREFTLTDVAVCNNMWAFIKANVEACASAGSPLFAIITTAEARRRTEQNKSYWKYVMLPIEQQAWSDGRQYTKEIWHEHYASKFGGCNEYRMPDGSMRQVRMSTTDMTVSEFNEYRIKVEADAAENFGVEFDVRKW